MSELNKVPGALSQLSTQQLDEMLRQELKQVTIDEEAVRGVLRELRQREKDVQVMLTPGQVKAWEDYRASVEKLEKPVRRDFSGWVIRAAAVLLVIGLLFVAMPGQANADSLWEKLLSWTSSFVEIFTPATENKNLDTYQYRTSNPGLQQVYDAVVELGVTDPVVPSWIPEGYELIVCENESTSKKQGIIACFSDGEESIVYKVDVHDLNEAHEYHRDETEADKYENFGVKHSVARNNDRWVVIWFQDKTECFITVDCEEDTLHRILDSIYVMEDYE